MGAKVIMQNENEFLSQFRYASDRFTIHMSFWSSPTPDSSYHNDRNTDINQFALRNMIYSDISYFQKKIIKLQFLWSITLGDPEWPNQEARFVILATGSRESFWAVINPTTDSSYHNDRNTNINHSEVDYKKKRGVKFPRPQLMPAPEGSNGVK
ncbi:hypothetical protein CDAR_230141 [Caerostris darwini]|uniref:Uncharacterized protein n=1 Tax=Caerostris darwini TaxID=1538125 RepID=A0AAV4U157_9ARAC|nr:hypothetical protein CDAR_230141 [Caerostris darwini]